jgi:3-methyladenine DNA glycosylase AlkD
MFTANDVKKELSHYADPNRSSHTASFFKSGPGQYSDGDRFLGITVPTCRKVAKLYATLSLDHIATLLESPWHEERETALIILVNQYIKHPEQRDTIYAFYLSHTAFINNWDLVDLSARDIVGRHIYENPAHQKDFDTLAASGVLWEKRIAMVATWYFLTQQDPKPTIRIATKLLHDPHDLIQKSVGWMLREMGKRVGREHLVQYLATTYTTMPRTTLRYAIEHFDPDVRQDYLKGRIK